VEAISFEVGVRPAHSGGKLEIDVQVAARVVELESGENIDG
jgi:hypothetical protein